MVDRLLAGSVRLGDGDDAVAVDLPEEITLDVELEAEDDDLTLDPELEWPHSAVDDSAATPDEETPGDAGEPSAPAGATDASQALARFELFRDRSGEWRWRLRHRNGNVIATSGEGYARKHDAQKGLRSVVQNAPGAEIAEDSED